MNVVIAVLMKQLEDANIKDQEESILEREAATETNKMLMTNGKGFAFKKSGVEGSSYSLDYKKVGETITYRL